MNDRDWMLLNAYADAELEAEEARALSSRLARDPALAAELRDLRALKTRLKALRRANCSARLGRPARSIAARLAAMAAMLLLAVAVGLVLMQAPSGERPPADGLLALHHDFAAREYRPGEGSPDIAAGLGVAPPDLSASNLRLVDMRLAGNPGAPVVGYHYRGPRGCRLTLAVGRSLGPSDGAALGSGWTVGELSVVLLADGMDARRFEAIASFAEAEMRRSHEADRLRIALVDRTASADPCA